MTIIGIGHIGVEKPAIGNVIGPGGSLGRCDQIATGDHQTERSQQTRGEFHDASPCDECVRTIYARTYRTPGLIAPVTVRNDSSLEHFEAAEISSNAIASVYSRTKKSPATKVVRG